MQGHLAFVGHASPTLLATLSNPLPHAVAMKWLQALEAYQGPHEGERRDWRLPRPLQRQRILLQPGAPRTSLALQFLLPTVFESGPIKKARPPAAAARFSGQSMHSCNPSDCSSTTVWLAPCRCCGRMTQCIGILHHLPRMSAWTAAWAQQACPGPCCVLCFHGVQCSQ